MPPPTTCAQGVTCGQVSLQLAGGGTLPLGITLAITSRVVQMREYSLAPCRRDISKAERELHTRASSTYESHRYLFLAPQVCRPVLLIPIAGRWSE